MSTRLILVSVVCTFSLFLSVTFVEADQHSGLCPSGFPRMVLYNGTGHCFMVGTQGPCGRMAVIASNPSNPNYGICQCKDYGSNNCFGRPLIPYGERCFFAFSQGPCKKGQWFVTNNQGKAECHKTPCPIIESQRDLLYSEFPASDFYFTMYGGNKCFKTGTRAFCNQGEKVFFLGADPLPQCLTYDPYDCNPTSSPSSSEEDGGVQKSFVAFGVPYDGI